VYQDLFGEGSYSGKGSYDVDAFSAALEGRIPENTLLSHDLFEGIFARAALVSDIEVFEDHPSRYDVSTARQHRWARGDWQLLPWILGVGSAAKRTGGRAAIPTIGRWKMLDNLRRTLVTPSAWLALVAGWTLPLAWALPWSGFVFATLALPSCCRSWPASAAPLRDLEAEPARHRRDLGWRSHSSASWSRCWRAGWLMLDAIARTLLRLFVTRRRMLSG
jgi:cyclic beta-1,2-glucan synthetase